MRHSVGWGERLEASGSLLVGLVAVLLALELALDRFPRGILVLACLALAILLGGVGVIGRGWVRVLCSCGALLVIGLTVVFLIEGGPDIAQGLVVVL